MSDVRPTFSAYGDGRFRRVFDHAPVGMMGLDRERRLLEVNPALCLALGYTAPELLSRPLDDFIHPDDQSGTKELIAKLFLQKSPSFQEEKRFIGKNGHPIWIALSAFFIEASEQFENYVLVLADDITQRKVAEDALRASEERYRSFVVNSSEAIWRFELEQPMPTTLPIKQQVDWIYQHAYLAECNDALARYCGHERADQLIGALIDRVFPPGSENLAAVRNLVGNNYRVHNSVSVTPDGQGVERYYSSTIIGIVVNGNLMRIWGTQHDVTRRTVAERKLQHSHEQLHSLVARLLSLREKECANLARDLHDSLGQSLTGLKMELAQIQKRLPEPDRDMSNRLHSAFAQIEDAIAQVRALATELRPAVLDQFGLVSAIEWQCQEFTKRTEIDFDCDLPETALELPPETATALFRIFQESMVNVIRHAQASRVWIALHRENDELVLTVKDDGRGITEAEITAADSLGLLGMRERAEILGGQFQIEGRPGRTQISVRLPLV